MESSKPLNQAYPVVSNYQVIGLIDFKLVIFDLFILPSPTVVLVRRHFLLLITPLLWQHCHLLFPVACTLYLGPFLAPLVCTGVVEKPLTCRFALAATKACTAGTFWRAMAEKSGR